MAKARRDWAWRRLQDSAPPEQGATNYRRPDFIQNKQGLTVRNHIPHTTKPALDRFFAHTQRVRIEGEVCIVWTGGSTFRVDESIVTTPARFYWKAMGKEKLGENDTLQRGCYTPRCVKHKRRQTQ